MPRVCSYCGTPWLDDDTPPHDYEVCLENAKIRLAHAVEDLARADAWVSEALNRSPYWRNNHLYPRERAGIALYLGYLGELLVIERWLKMPMPEKPVHGDSGIDLTLPDGRTIDVKTRNKRGGHDLIFGQSERTFRADLSVLALVDLILFKGWVRGWIDRHEFYDIAESGCIEGQDILSVPSFVLHHPRELWQQVYPEGRPA